MTDEPVRKPWLYRFNFRLRSLMIAIGILCVAMGWIIHRARVQREAVMAVQRAGGEVMYDWEWKWVKGAPVRTGTTRWPDWLVERIGIDYLANSNAL